MVLYIIIIDTIIIKKPNSFENTCNKLKNLEECYKTIV